VTRWSRAHRLGVEEGRDRPPDLLQRAQLAVRLRQVAGALLDLLLYSRPYEPCSSFRHAVELLGKLADLVPGVHLDAMAEVARLELARADLQRLDRRDQTPREQHAGEDGDADPSSSSHAVRNRRL
jgi:hypothetical protein